MYVVDSNPSEWWQRGQDYLGDISSMLPSWVRGHTLHVIDSNDITRECNIAECDINMTHVTADTESCVRPPVRHAQDTI